ncbi:MAG TPA: hypothetical protein DCX32_04825 [Candidatus Moranbacteria bacterium]|nr:MAG: hypothetical protein UW95_C0021G0007 [Parcubacteria group bacterium GW2011_GWC1_45_14]HAV11830.1 hypothetical protein [Candidatus Moranbacteria bacterium]
MYHDIRTLNANQLLALDPREVTRIFTPQEILHIFYALDGFWSYDYEAVGLARVGFHAKLNSGNCSDGFFFAEIVLRHPNLRMILAKQMAWRFLERGIPKPDYVIGIPNGAKKLGEDFGNLLDIPLAEMVKEDGKLRLVTKLGEYKRLLFVEDLCTRGTRFIEAGGVVLDAEPTTIIIPEEEVILNRGGLKCIEARGVSCHINAAVVHRINDWAPGPDTCPLCKLGSTPMKPKESDESWRIITTAQAA